MERIFTESIDDKYAGQTIKSILKGKYRMSTELIKRLKNTQNGICVNGECEKVIYTLKKGDKLRLLLKEDASEGIMPVKCSFGLVYEDEDILIADKPGDMPTHPSAGHREKTLANGVMYHYKEKGEERVFRAVNRLDKGTSGLMAVAKNMYIHSILSAEHQRGELCRKYFCIAEGEISKGGVIEVPIARSKDSIIKRCADKSGQYALTEYMPLYTANNRTLLEVSPKTGRTHQIRVHFAYMGHPLIGDWLYGKEDKELIKRPALHSCRLSFIHPITGERMNFESGLPEDMKKLIN